MRGDFSRQTFDSSRHYTKVLMQQGRVQIDADHNEQQEIHQHRTEAQTADVIGPAGAPADPASFKLISDGRRLTLTKGRYYVDGILCENEIDLPLTEQPDPPAGFELPSEEGLYLAWLRVHEALVTALDEPGMREVALGGADTAARARTIWQIGLLPVRSITPEQLYPLGEWLEARRQLEEERPSGLEAEGETGDRRAEIDDVLATLDERIVRLLSGNDCDSLPEWPGLVSATTGKLAARTRPAEKPRDPCIVPATAGYKGLENQLYRIEIHNGSDSRSGATFKWSRDNGSVVTAIRAFNGKTLTVADLGRDEILGFSGGQWVEIVDSVTERNHLPGALAQIDSVKPETREIILRTEPVPIPAENKPKLRRWDQIGAAATDAGVPVKPGWLHTERHLDVSFTAGSYSTGDYWLIPARTALTGNGSVHPDTGDIDWPHTTPQAPHGVAYHYGCLALVYVGPDERGRNRINVARDCRPLFPALTDLTAMFYVAGDGQDIVVDLSRDADALTVAPQPLEVGVSNGKWPVGGRTVRFRIVEGDGQLQGIAPTVDVVTGRDGVAGCSWELDPATPVQRVEATLLDGWGRPMHLPIRFSATVVRKERCVRVTDVFVGDPEVKLERGMELSPEILSRGIRVFCDREVDAASVAGRGDCFIAIEIPFVPTDDGQPLAEMPIGFQPVVLDAEVTVDGTEIRWTPTRQTHSLLTEQAELLSTLDGGNPLLARLEVKGGFLHEHQSCGCGGFDTWFRLAPRSSRLTRLVVDPARIPLGGRTKGEVTLSGPAPEDVTIDLSAIYPEWLTEHLEVVGAFVRIPETVTVEAGADSAFFTITTKRRVGIRLPPERAEELAVEITASHEGETVSATLTIASEV